MTSRISGPISRWIGGTGAAVTLLLVLCSCQRQATVAPDSEVVARVGSSTLRLGEFEMLLRSVRAQGRAIAPEALLDEWVERAVLLARAEELRVRESPEVRRAMENLLIGELKRRELEPRLASATVSDTEIEQEYLRDSAAFSRPETRRIAVLRQRFDGLASDAKRERIRTRMSEARLQALERTADAQGFGALAVNASDDPSTRHRGGEAGWVGSGDTWRWEPPVIEAAFALELPGEISPVIETTNAVYLVRLEEVRPAQRLPLTEAAPRIRQRLTLERRAAVLAAFASSCRIGRTLEVHPERLERSAGPADPPDAQAPAVGAADALVRLRPPQSPPSIPQ